MLAPTLYASLKGGALQDAKSRRHLVCGAKSDAKMRYRHYTRSCEEMQEQESEFTDTRPKTKMRDCSCAFGQAYLFKNLKLCQTRFVSSGERLVIIPLHSCLL